MLRRSLIFLIFGLFVWGCKPVHDPGRRQVVVYAASSLTDVMRTLTESFQTNHPDIDVVTAFAGSQALRLQILQGAPADIFFSANPHHVESLVTDGVLSETKVFGYNRLAIIVPKENPSGLKSPADLGKAKRIVIGNPEVPIGKYTREWLSRMDEITETAFSQQVLSQVVSQENNVRLLRAKVELGEADAAIVYWTDARSSDRVVELTMDTAPNIRTVYQLGVVSRTRINPALHQWLQFLESDEAQRVIKQEGLILP